MKSLGASQLLKRYTGENNGQARFPTGVVVFLTEAKAKNPRMYKRISKNHSSKLVSPPIPHTEL